MSTFSGGFPGWLQLTGLYSGIALALLGIIAVGMHLHSARREGGLKTVEPQHLILIGLAGVWVFSTVALVGVIWQQYRGTPSASTPGKLEILASKPRPKPDGELLGAIRWHFLGTAAHGRGHYVDYYGVQATGRNESDEFIRDFSGTIRSEVTGREYPITVNDGHGNLVDPKGYGIPGKHQFHLQVRFKDGKPMTMTDFLSDFRRLTFLMKYNGAEYKRTFSPEEVEAWVARAEADLKRNPPVPTAGIRKIEDA